jgi:hypothetical protein
LSAARKEIAGGGDNQSQIELEADGLTPTIPRLIQATKVLSEARMGTLPKHFGRYMMIVEDAIYTSMRRLCAQYEGDSWDFFELSNGGFYMAPESQSLVIRVDGNGYECRMSADAAGITACLFAFNHVSLQIQSELVAGHYYQLLDFVRTHAEVSLISRAID